jgi:hypothetical protein
VLAGATTLLIVAGLIGKWALSPNSERGTTPLVLLNGAPRLRVSESGTAQRWARDKAVTVVIDQSIEALGSGAREAVIESFGTWLGSGAKLPELVFDARSGLRPKLERDGISAVVYAPIEVAGHRNDLAITIGFADAESGRIQESDIIINSTRKFAVLKKPSPLSRSGEAASEHAASTLHGDDPAEDSAASNCDQRYDLQSVLTHEVGHFFGLDEDEEDGTATMFFKTERCDLEKRDLGAADSATLVELYSSDEEADETKAPGGCSISP